MDDNGIRFSELTINDISIFDKNGTLNTFSLKNLSHIPPASFEGIADQRIRQDYLTKVKNYITRERHINLLKNTQLNSLQEDAVRDYGFNVLNTLSTGRIAEIPVLSWKGLSIRDSRKIYNKLSKYYKKQGMTVISREDLRRFTKRDLDAAGFDILNTLPASDLATIPAEAVNEFEKKDLLLPKINEYLLAEEFKNLTSSPDLSRIQLSDFRRFGVEFFNKLPLEKLRTLPFDTLEESDLEGSSDFSRKLSEMKNSQEIVGMIQSGEKPSKETLLRVGYDVIQNISKDYPDEFYSIDPTFFSVFTPGESSKLIARRIEIYKKKRPLLTEEQIEDIIKNHPKPPGTGNSMVGKAHEHNMTKLRKILKRTRFIDNEEAFKEFKTELYRRFYRACIEPGKSIGVLAGVAIAGPATQLSLDSHRLAGAQSGIGDAFNYIKNYLTGSRTNKQPKTFIFFKDPHTGDSMHDARHTETFDSILDKRIEIEQVTIHDVISKSYLTNNTEDIEKVRRLINLHSLIRPNRFQENRPYDTTNVLKLELDSFKMFTHRINMGDVCAAIEGPNIGKIIKQELACVWQSYEDGILYVLVLESLVTSMDTSISVDPETFLDRHVQSQFKNIVLKGIPDIVSLTPKSYNTKDVIKSFTRVKGNTHTITLDRSRTSRKGFDDVIKIFKSLNWVILGTNYNNLTIYISHPSDNLQNVFESEYVKTGDSPNNYNIGSFVKNNGNSHTVLIDKWKTRTDGASIEDVAAMLRHLNWDVLGTNYDHLTIYISHPSNDLKKEFDSEYKRITSKPKRDLTVNEENFIGSTKIWYGDAIGINMNEIIWRDDIDLYRTYPNDARIIASYVGIDAARIFLIRIFTQLLNEFSIYINNRHIITIFELLTNLGIVNTTTYTGINRREVGFLGQAAFDRPMINLVKNGVVGAVDKMTGVSSGNFIGGRLQMGTGIFETATKFVEREPPESLPMVEGLESIQLEDGPENILDIIRPEERKPAFGEMTVQDSGRLNVLTSPQVSPQDSDSRVAVLDATKLQNLVYVPVFESSEVSSFAKAPEPSEGSASYIEVTSSNIDDILAEINGTNTTPVHVYTSFFDIPLDKIVSAIRPVPVSPTETFAAPDSKSFYQNLLGKSITTIPPISENINVTIDPSEFLRRLRILG